MAVVISKAQSLVVLPYFDGNNYAYWKVRIRAFLKSLDKCVWMLVKKGWTKSATNIDSCSKDELNAYNWNNKGFHAIFMVVSQDEVNRISMSETAMESWEVLEVTYEGTKIVWKFSDVYL